MNRILKWVKELADLKNHFKIDYSCAKSKDAAVFKGNKYRITVLSDILIRLEYNNDGVFEDRPTEFAWNRDFEVPLIQVNQNNRSLNVSTKYFRLEYIKETSMFPKGAKENNLKISLNNTDKVWYINHPEARNLYGSEVSLDDISGKIPLLKGLFSKSSGVPSYIDVLKEALGEKCHKTSTPSAVSGKIGEGTLSEILEWIPKELFIKYPAQPRLAKFTFKSCKPAVTDKFLKRCLNHNS